MHLFRFFFFLIDQGGMVSLKLLKRRKNYFICVVTFVRFFYINLVKNGISIKAWV